MNPFENLPAMTKDIAEYNKNQLELAREEMRMRNSRFYSLLIAIMTIVVGTGMFVMEALKIIYQR